MTSIFIELFLIEYQRSTFSNRPICGKQNEQYIKELWVKRKCGRKNLNTGKGSAWALL
jgi:hypothetical protein